MNAPLVKAETPRLFRTPADVQAMPGRALSRITELERRLTEILDLIDGREDADHDGNGFRPNIFMRIAMTARGEDRP